MSAVAQAAPLAVPLPRLVVGSAFSLGAMSEGRIIALAGASTADSDDPVDQAALTALRAGYPDLDAPLVDAEDVDPARLDRRYSLVRARECPRPDGSTGDVVIMRGDLDAVLAKATANRTARSVLRRNADIVTRRGWRPLAVAVADVGAHDEVGPFRVQGFVTVCPDTVHKTTDDVTSGPAVWARVNVWSVSLRIQHWTNVALIFILSCTGLYIMDPFFGPVARAAEASGYLMGWVRFVHFTAAFAWLVLGATRVWQAFTSHDRYLRWPAMWPLKSKADVRNLGRVLQHYVFIKKDAPLYLGHNPLQQLTYTGVYIGCAIQMLVGFVLFGIYHQDNPFWVLVSTPTHWFGIAPIRIVHVMLMFLIWVFVIVHVYLVFRSDSLERHGGLSAMVNGGVWVRRGATPVDAPMVE